MDTVTTSATQPLIIRTQDVVGFSQGLGEMRILIDGAKSQNEWWFGHCEELPGFMTTLHIHHNMDEYVYVLDGLLSVFTCGQWHDLSSGTFALLPKGISHAQGNTSSARFASLERAVLLDSNACFRSWISWLSVSRRILLSSAKKRPGF